MFPPRSSRYCSAFTLIELLIVIAIIAILAVVTVLTLNPAQLLARSRDANRIADMATLNGVATLYQANQQGASIGVASTTYISIPDSSSACANTGLSPLGGGFSYACSPSASLKNTDSSGWIPMNLQNIAGGSPIGTLPVDPTNQTSSNLYYTYTTDGANYALTAAFESSKYLKQYLLQTSPDPTRYAVGTNSGLVAPSEGLVGYWPLDEGSGSLANDMSGSGNSGTWSGTPIGTGSTYYTAGKVGAWAGIFDGTSDYIVVSSSPSFAFGTNSVTITFWIKGTQLGTGHGGTILAKRSGGTGIQISLDGNVACRINGFIGDGTNYPFGYLDGGGFCDNNWHFIAVVFNKATTMSDYIDGVAGAHPIADNSVGSITNITNLVIGNWPTDNVHFPGQLDDVRVYNRALSSTEIKTLYNAEK